MDIRNILERDKCEAFMQIAQEFVSLTGDKYTGLDQNLYLALQLCDDIIEAINSTVSEIKENIKNKVSINLSHIIRIRDKKMVIVVSKNRILNAIREEENEALKIIEEIEEM